MITTFPTNVRLASHKFSLDPNFHDRPSEKLTSLADKFANLNDADKATHGYLPDRTSDTASQQIISAGNLVCAWDNDALAGFYLADHYRYTYAPHRFQYFHGIMERICNQMRIAPDSVGCGAQCVIDIPYQGSGLRSVLLYALLSKISGEGGGFSSLFSKISKDNMRATKGHMRDGWYSIAEDEEYVFVWLDIRTALVDLADIYTRAQSA